MSSVKDLFVLSSELQWEVSDVMIQLNLKTFEVWFSVKSRLCVWSEMSHQLGVFSVPVMCTALIQKHSQRRRNVFHQLLLLVLLLFTVMICIVTFFVYRLNSLRAFQTYSQFWSLCYQMPICIKKDWLKSICNFPGINLKSTLLLHSKKPLCFYGPTVKSTGI